MWRIDLTHIYGHFTDLTHSANCTKRKIKMVAPHRPFHVYKGFEHVLLPFNLLIAFSPQRNQQRDFCKNMNARMSNNNRQGYTGWEIYFTERCKSLFVLRTFLLSTVRRNSTLRVHHTLWFLLIRPLQFIPRGYIE